MQMRFVVSAKEGGFIVIDNRFECQGFAANAPGSGRPIFRTTRGSIDTKQRGRGKVEDGAGSVGEVEATGVGVKLAGASRFLGRCAWSRGFR